ncbi:MAG: endonuclease III [Clostridia bacterium]|nr:endonuclease III [Clostridia bacterium]
MTEKQRAKEAVALLEAYYPQAQCALLWQGEPWKLLVMGRLSAQCTDKRVNIVCEKLFEVFPTPEDLAYAPLNEIEELVRPCGLYRTKAAQIKEECRMLVEEFGGVLPSDMDTLLRFPGVGRKIANLLRGDVFHLPAIVADTHCIRLSGRLGFVKEGEKRPEAVEQKLSKIVEEEKQNDFCHRLVQFGRDVCTARAPKCTVCPLGEICRKRQRELKAGTGKKCCS